MYECMYVHIYIYSSIRVVLLRSTREQAIQVFGQILHTKRKKKKHYVEVKSLKKVEIRGRKSPKSRVEKKILLRKAMADAAI